MQYPKKELKKSVTESQAAAQAIFSPQTNKKMYVKLANGKKLMINKANVTGASSTQV